MDGILDEMERPGSTLGGAEVEMRLANTSQRLANFVLDGAVYVVFILFLMGIDGLFIHDPDLQDDFSAFGGLNLLFFPFVYKWLMEGLFGKTIGKMLTKTRVVTTAGGSIGLAKAFIRSLVRYTFINTFSIFFSEGRNVLWHDSITQTRVVRDEVEEWGRGENGNIAELV